MKRLFKVLSPAKVNLHLEIGERREDGFHDVRTIMQTLTLHDMVTVSFDDGDDGETSPADHEGPTVELSCVTREGIPPLDVPPEDNIAYKAAEKLAKKFDQNRGHIAISIEKHIPFQAGLGGGSSNAAAVIAGLCRAWGKSQTCDEAIEVASELGADVAFFLYGPCALLEGRGDVFKRPISPLEGEVVIVKIDEGVSTKAAYEAFDALEKHQESSLAPDISDARDVELFNNLAQASENVVARLADVRAWLSAQSGIATDESGRQKILLCGSGSATFAIVEASHSGGRNSAAIVAAAKREGFWARSCTFSKVGVAVLPSQGASSNIGAAREIW